MKRIVFQMSKFIWRAVGGIYPGSLSLSLTSMTNSAIFEKKDKSLVTPYGFVVTNRNWYASVSRISAEEYVNKKEDKMEYDKNYLFTHMFVQ